MIKALLNYLFAMQLFLYFESCLTLASNGAWYYKKFLYITAISFISTAALTVQALMVENGFLNKYF